MQLVLSLILLTSCSYLGYSLGKFYHIREQFLVDLISFCNALKSEISFSKNGLVETIKNRQSSYRFAFNKVLKGYVKCLEEGAYININLLNHYIDTVYLNEDELQELFRLFDGLGKSDVFHQVELLDQFILVFSHYLKVAQEEKKKYAGLFSKLGFLTGIFLVVILL